MKRLALVLITILLASCKKDKAGPTQPEAPPPPTYTLSVSLGEGVSGTPVAGNYPYQQGQAVSYSYQALPGYRNAYVVLDSSVPMASGTLVMHGNRRLAVGAEKIIPVLPQDAPAVQAAQEVLVRKDSASFQRYLEATLRLMETSSSEEAILRARAVSEQVFASASFAEMRALQMALSGKVFLVSMPSSAAPSSTAIESHVGAYLMSGMSARLDNAVVGTLELVQIIREAKLPFPVPVRLFYNSSAYREMQESGYCVVNAICAIAGGYDFSEAVRMFLLVISRLDPPGEAEARGFASILRAECNAGRGSLLVPHSQGTLTAHLAVRELGSNNACVAVISLGSPIGKSNWNVSTNLFHCHLASGNAVTDIIARLGQNDCPKVITSVGKKADSIATQSTSSLVMRTQEELRLHRLSESYLGAPESRAVVREKVLDFATLLQARGDSIRRASTSARIYASGVATISTGPSSLWIVPPHAGGKDTLVARLSESSGYSPFITDIAKWPSGELWAISFEKLYRVNAASGLLDSIATFKLEVSPNAFAVSGDDKIYIATAEGMLYVLSKELQAVSALPFGSGYISSGDLEFCGGKLYGVLRNSANADVFAEINLVTGKPAPLGTGFVSERVWGLACSGDNLYGLTAGTFGEMGKLLKIDMHTGAHTFLRNLSFHASGAAAPPRP